ncbi:VIT domain-containing protein [Granulosicoccus sp. 3-233]|uniref:VIT domain-containing protein n=1 Tax=Granulosicoccus sp. 3-233 TaxID=3417969 RepID=UPI003D32942C
MPIAQDGHRLTPTLRATARSARARGRLLPAFVGWACLFFSMPGQAAPEVARQATDHGSGALVLHHQEGDADALLLNADMDLQVQGLLANMTLKQTFRNTSKLWLNGSYLFPLPEDAAIRGLRIHVGERTILGRISPRDQARSDFEQAVQAGQVASLMEQQRPNLFTLQIANIAPEQDVRVTLDVMLPVQLSAQGMSLIIPTTLTPRYLTHDTVHAQALQPDFIAPEQKSGPTLDVTLSIDPLEDFDSVTGTVSLVPTSDQRFRIDDMPMNQDLIINWPTQYDPATRAQAFVSLHEGERYVQLLMNPPEQLEIDDQRARELIIVLDKSGSMAGVSMRAAMDALVYAIDRLTEDDLLNIVAFDDLHYPLFEQSLAATQQVKQQAKRFAARLQAEGGTEMDAALNHALRVTDRHTTEAEHGVDRLKQIVFITDGSVGNEDALLRNIRSNLGNSRLFTVGIGSAPNRWFLDKAAEAGRGASVSIRNEHEAADAISELLDKLRYPVLTDIAVHFPHGQGEIYPQPVPDLYADRPAMWVGKLSDEVDEIVVTGVRREEAFTQTLTLAQAATAPQLSIPTSAPSVAMHWARQKIAALEDEQRHAADPESNREAITQLAIHTGLVTPYTSLIAVEQTPSRPLTDPLAAASVANRLPHGSLMMGIKLPQGAAGVDTLLWVSLFLCLTGCSLLPLSRKIH